MSALSILEIHNHHLRTVTSTPSRVARHAYAKAADLPVMLTAQAKDRKFCRAYAIEDASVRAVWCHEQFGTTPFTYVAHVPGWSLEGPFWAAINQDSIPLTANWKEEGIHTCHAAHRFACDAFLDSEVSTVIFLNDSQTGVRVAWERNPMTQLPVLVAWDREWQELS